MTIAALFVCPNGPYANVSGIDIYDQTRDARKYTGPYRVIAHPPCQRWGRYWSGGPSVKVRRKLGDDNGCFESALESVRKYGGVLEHPAYTHAWEKYGIDKPPRKGGWVPAGDGVGHVCHVEQGHYGHPARKGTWLYAVNTDLPELMWGVSTGKKQRMDEGFHSTEERRIARAQGIKPLRRLSASQRIHTPIAFRDLLISLVQVNL